MEKEEAERLVEALVESFRDEAIECEDPFDLYINRIKAHLYANPDEMSQRIAAGHQTLLKALDSKE